MPKATPNTAPDATVVPPENDKQQIWRYMNFAKFSWMLAKSALFFPSVGEIQKVDKFEGAIAVDWIRALYNLRIDDVEGQKISGKDTIKLARSLSAMIKFFCINCWHMNDFESAAMWHQYGQAEYSIAIRSAYAQLRKCLPKEIVIGKVQYVDIQNLFWNKMPTAHMPLFYKRIEYQHERELRACRRLNSADQLQEINWVQRAFDDDELDLPSIPIVAGEEEQIDLKSLISAIHVSPLAPGWFVDAVTRVREKMGFEGIPVCQSHLSVAPPTAFDEWRKMLSDES